MKFTKIKKILNKLKEKQNPIELYGINWNNIDNKKIAIFFNFNPWKRKIFYQFFKNHKCAFVQGKQKFNPAIFRFLKEISKNNELTFVTWGENKIPYFAYLFKIIYGQKIKLLKMEDGFLRSNNTGILHTKPDSICIDKTGIYFNSNKPSDLENLLNNYNFKENDEYLKRAKKCMELFCISSLSKYYTSKYESVEKMSLNIEYPFENKNYNILVIGQVEDDASIKYGSKKIKTNKDLIKEAKKDFPEANIIFRPHPDYMLKLKKDPVNYKIISKMCFIANNDIPLNKLIEKSDHIYVITSLVGLEALIRGKKVTTCGAPFYSGWGLTEDKVKIKRRKRIRTLEELFAICYLIYPKYYHPHTNNEINFEELAVCYIFESINLHNIFTLKDSSVFNKIKNQNFQYIKILNKILEDGKYGNLEKCLLDNNFEINSFFLIFKILRYSSNYNLIAKLFELIIDYINNNINKLSNNYHCFLNLLQLIANEQSQAGQRIIKFKLKQQVLNTIFKINKYHNSKTLFELFLKLNTQNLKYNYVEDIIENLEQNTCEMNIYYYNQNEDFVKNKQYVFNYLLRILSVNPIRKEKNSKYRERLLSMVENEYCQCLNHQEFLEMMKRI